MQLVLVLGMQPHAGEPPQPALVVDDAHCVTPARAARLPRAASGRVRPVPSRDARGRFVAFPTTSVPSWYVFCADAYRIPADSDVTPMQMPPQPPQQREPLPPARVVRRQRRRMDWAEIATWLVLALFIAVVGWHGMHLQFPHR